MYPWYGVEREYLRLRESELARDLRIANLIREASLGRPGLRERALLRVSDALIATGEWLRRDQCGDALTEAVCG